MKKYTLELYIIGYTSLAKNAIANAKELCNSKSLKDQYELKVINLEEHPELADSQNIIATPMLMKKLPKPLRRIIGNLHDKEKVLAGLEIHEKT